jgi:hypothetical protein
MVGFQFQDAAVQSVERQIMRGQHQHVIGHAAAQVGERGKIGAEWIAQRLPPPHADIGGYPRQHLIRRQEQIFLATQQHRLLGGVTSPGQNLEITITDAQSLAVHQSVVGGGQAAGHAQIVMAAAQQCVGDLGRQAVAQIEVAMNSDTRRVLVMPKGLGEEVIDLWHPHRHPESLRHPAGQPGMVRMEVGDDQLRDRPAAQPAGHRFLPDRAGAQVRYAGVDHRPAVPIFDQVDIHMIEQERQGQTQP